MTSQSIGKWASSPPAPRVLISGVLAAALVLMQSTRAHADRIHAVQYSNQYALTHNECYHYFRNGEDEGVDCTNFISQCLWAGGLEETWIFPAWWYTSESEYAHAWTVTDRLSSSLLMHSRARDWGNVDQVKKFVDSKGNVFHYDQSSVGDLLLYDLPRWNDDGWLDLIHWDHAAIKAAYKRTCARCAWRGSELSFYGPLPLPSHDGPSRH